MVSIKYMFTIFLNNDTIKKILLTDPYISYLVDAIKHVTSTHDE